jgi:hypothetical protein
LHLYGLNGIDFKISFNLLKSEVILKEKNVNALSSGINGSSKNALQSGVLSEDLFQLEMPVGRKELLNRCIELGLPVEESDDDVILKLIYEAAKDKFNYEKKI